MTGQDDDTRTTEAQDRRSERRKANYGTVWWLIAATFAFALPRSWDAGETVQSIGWWTGIVLLLVGAMFLVRDLRRER